MPAYPRVDLRLRLFHEFLQMSQNCPIALGSPSGPSDFSSPESVDTRQGGKLFSQFHLEQLQVLIA